MTGDDCGQARAWDLTVDQEMFIPQLDFSSDDYPDEVIQFSPDGRYLFGQVALELATLPSLYSLSTSITNLCCLNSHIIRRKTK